MAKIALYNKYRPKKFAEVLGQNHVTNTLLNAIKNKKISHAYIFTGPRGVGKTTIARLISLSANCEKPKDGEPCGACDSCKNIFAGKAIDVFEIDAASNRGIDEIRELKEKVRFTPSSLKYKIFIIDEVHMLTKEAFNALLKTLEEPPDHAIFVLATTEAHKVPQTILSRCQRFDFKRISIKDLIQRLTEIVKKEEIKATDEALGIIAEASEGGFRDAISFLDQISSYKQDEKIEAKDIFDLLGMSDFKAIVDFIGFLFERKTKEALLLINALVDRGIDINQFTKNIIDTLRKILHLKIVGETNIEMSKEHIENAKALAERATSREITRMITTVLSFSNNFKNLPLPQIPLELSVVSLTYDQDDKPKESIKSEKTTKTVEKTEDLGDFWHDLLLEIKGQNSSIHALLRVCSYEVKDTEILLSFPYKFHKERVDELKNKKIVEGAIKRVFGKDLKVKCQVKEGLKVDLSKKKDEELLKTAVDIFGGEIIN